MAARPSPMPQAATATSPPPAAAPAMAARSPAAPATAASPTPRPTAAPSRSATSTPAAMPATPSASATPSPARIAPICCEPPPYKPVPVCRSNPAPAPAPVKTPPGKVVVVTRLPTQAPDRPAFGAARQPHGPGGGTASIAVRRRSIDPEPTRVLPRNPTLRGREAERRFLQPWRWRRSVAGEGDGVIRYRGIAGQWSMDWRSERSRAQELRPAPCTLPPRRPRHEVGRAAG